VSQFFYHIFCIFYSCYNSIEFHLLLSHINIIFLSCESQNALFWIAKDLFEVFFISCAENGMGEMSKWISYTFVNFFTTSMTLIVIVILASCYPDTSIWNVWAESYKLSDLAIIKKNYFNTISAICLSSGIIHIIVFIGHAYQLSKECHKNAVSQEKESAG